jgi:hypothetical protein
MNSAEGYYYDYEGTFLGGPYKGSSKVKVCKNMSKEAGIVKGKKITYDSFHDPVDLEIEYNDFIKIAAIVMGESTNKSAYNLSGIYKITDNEIKNKYYISKEDSFLEKKNMAMCCISNANEYFKGIIAEGLKGNFSYAIGTPRYNLLMNEDIEKRNNKEELRVSIKATISGVLDYKENIKNGFAVATQWDGVDVLKYWNNPHERNRSGTIDIEGAFFNYISFLLTINYIPEKTGLKNCHAEVNKINKKYDLEIAEVKNDKKMEPDIKQRYVDKLEQQKGIFANFEKIKTQEVIRKIKEMRESTKGKQLSTKEDCTNEATKASALKKGYLTTAFVGATIFYLEFRNKEFKSVIEKQLKK